MSSLSINPPFPIFTDVDGQPLEAGYIYIGQPNLDPQSFPQQAYWDSELTIPASVPIRTLGGYPVRNGTPARLYVASNYSIRVLNKNNSRIYSSPASTYWTDSSDISYTSSLTGTFSRTIQSKLNESISILDFIPSQYHDAIKNNTSIVDVSSYVQTATNSGSAIYWPAGTYIVNSINNDSAPNKLVVWHGESIGKVTLKSSARQNYILRIGNIGDTWGSGGSVYLSDMRFEYGQAGWDTLAGNPLIGLLTLYRVNMTRIHSISMFGSNNCGIYTNSMGYSSITECSIGGHRYDCVNFDSTDLDNAVTSTLVESCQINTGLRSSVRIKDGFNITVTQCQLEDSGAAVIITGTNNRVIAITENYVEQTRGDYDIDAGTGYGVGFTITNNYLFGTPDKATINLPTNPDSNFQPLTWFGNYPDATFNIAGSAYAGQLNANTVTGNFSNVNWLQGSRSISGTATLVGSYAWNSGQQTAVVEARTANSFGAGIKGASTAGIAYFGLLRGAAFDNSDVNTRSYLALQYENKGAINTDPTDGYALHIYGGQSPRAQQSLKCSHVGGVVMYTGGLGNTMNGTPNLNDAALFLNKVNTTNRSINATGTVNASGADYAEYMTKSGDFTLEKGAICGINSNGLLTNKFDESVSFVVKSTAPSYVGGDTWGNGDDIGEAPIKPTQKIVVESNGNPTLDSNGNNIYESDEDYNSRVDQFNIDYAEWDSKFQAKRACVDRIAFCGQVPVNILNAIPGQYIIPVNIDGDISGVAVTSPTFDQYLISIGKVIAIEDDGRARIIVKVS